MALGGVIGGILGSAVGGPLGASIGTGLGQTIQGAIQKKKAQGMAPSPVDVGRQKLLNDLYRMQQARKTGTAYNPQIAAGKQMAKSLSKNAFAAGGPVNQGIYSNLVSQTMNTIAQQSAQDVLQGYGLIDKSVEQAEKRKFDVTSLEQTKMEADAAENEKAGFQNLAAGLQPKGDYKYNPETDSYEQGPGQKIQDILTPGKKKKKNAAGEIIETEEEETEGKG
jgi:hypothetical protein